MLSSRKIRSMDKTDNQNQQRFIYWGLPVLGMLLCLWYVKEATCDIVYTDYIRLVNTYLPDVLNPRKFFVPDVLTRIPVNYLSRIINVTFFGYSTTFDMALGILGLGLSGLVLGGLRGLPCPGHRRYPPALEGGTSPPAMLYHVDTNVDDQVEQLGLFTMLRLDTKHMISR